MAIIGKENVREADANITTAWNQYGVKFQAVIQGDEEPLDLTDRFVTVVMHYNFSEAVFAYLMVELRLTKAEHLRLQEHSDDVLFTIGINKFDPTGETPEEYHLNYYDGVLLKPIDISKEVIEPTDELNADDSSDQADSMPQYPMKLFLFKREHLYFNKTLCSGIFAETTLYDVMLYMINQNFARTEMDFHIGSFHNQKIYEQIIVPPTTFVGAVRYLQKAYGIYNNGIDLFFDFKDVWILDRNAVIGGAPVSGITTNVVIELYSEKEGDRSALPSRQMTFYDAKADSYVVRTISTPGLSRPHNSQKEIYGERAIVRSSTQKTDVEKNFLDLTFGTTPNDNRRLKEAVYWNPFSHPQLESEFKVEASKNFQTIELVIRDADLEVFALNRKYTIIDKNDSFDMDLGGEYRIADLEFILNPRGGGRGTIGAYARIRLRRIIQTE